MQLSGVGYVDTQTRLDISGTHYPIITFELVFLKEQGMFTKKLFKLSLQFVTLHRYLTHMHNLKNFHCLRKWKTCNPLRKHRLTKKNLNWIYSWQDLKI